MNMFDVRLKGAFGACWLVQVSTPPTVDRGQRWAGYNYRGGADIGAAAPAVVSIGNGRHQCPGHRLQYRAAGIGIGGRPVPQLA